MHAVFFGLKGAYWESNFPFKKLKPNSIFNDFAISWSPINEIDPDFFYFKYMGQKLTSNPIGPDHTKCSEVEAE